MIQSRTKPIWAFSDADRVRLQPLVDQMVHMANRLARRAIELTDTREDAIDIIQGGCEFIAAMAREKILEQVDRGEWSARGILQREDISITIHVDARTAYEDPDANLLSMSILPRAVLS
jgi:hypothetical protein